MRHRHSSQTLLSQLPLLFYRGITFHIFPFDVLLAKGNGSAPPSLFFPLSSFPSPLLFPSVSAAVMLKQLFSKKRQNKSAPKGENNVKSPPINPVLAYVSLSKENSCSSSTGFIHEGPEDTSFHGNDRNSNYSCVSGDSDSYVPRNARAIDPVKGPDASASTAAAVAGAKSASAKPPTPDAPDVVVRAQRYVYDTVSHKWGAQAVHIRILHPNRGIGQDNLHVYFACDLIVSRNAAIRPTNIKAAASSEHEILEDAEPPSDEEEAVATSVASGRAETAGGGGTIRVIPAVARLYRHSIANVTDADYYGDGKAQAVAEAFAQVFNRTSAGGGVPLPLLTNRNVCRLSVRRLPAELRSQSKGFFSYVTKDSRDILMLLEPDVRECKALGISFSLLPSRRPHSENEAVPINSVPEEGGHITSGDNSRSTAKPVEGQQAEGDVFPPFDTTKYDKNDLKRVAEAFSHFTYEASNTSLVVHGLLYSHRYLVDPLVYTAKHRGFGIGNSGPKAIEWWKGHHHCNDICRLHGLEAVNVSPED